MTTLPRLLTSAVALGLALTAAAVPTDPLQSGFLNPPDSARPQTWWHWMNGNITREGITTDLEAMKHIGLGGATIVNVDCGIPAGQVPFMSPTWRADFKFAVQEADRLGFKLCVENCAGWSSSGGPWNTVTNAMQRLTSAETRVEGPAVFDAVLSQPPTTLDYYRDIAVLAFKAPPVVTRPVGEDAATSLAPARLEIQRAVYGADGGAFADVKARLAARLQSGQLSITAANDELGGDPDYGRVKQLHVEYTLNGKPGTVTADEGETLIFPTNASQMVVVLSPGKSSVNRTFVQPPPAGPATAGVTIPHNGIVDLTAHLAAGGRLRWSVPPGAWIILRLGYTPTGVNNHPAPREGTGLECDKFSKTALDAHWAGFMQKVLDDLGPLAGKTLNSSLIDSYEVGGQDWTANFRREFQKRRGYDPLPFLPVFTRRIVDNPAVTERFLWDLRRTVADLFADNYYRHFTELCHRHGLLSAVEPYTGPFESLQCGAPADVVMGEFWCGSQGDPSVKLAASVAHIYGKTLVGAESFTADPGAGRWQNDPYSLKTLGDLMYCQGLNRYYFHRYAMQPWTNRWPGMTMGPYGFHFERTVTWWGQGKPWIDYLTRCQFLLQQGRAVADAAYFTGESAPVEMRVGDPALPAGYDYDAVNADVLRHATVKHGRLTLAGGASYAALILPPTDANLTPPTLQRLRQLVRAGATVVGPRPQNAPGLTGYPQCDAGVKQLADELWGPCDGTRVRENPDGRGRVVWGQSLADVFAAQNLKPDFEWANATNRTRLAYAHRVADHTDIYFVSNQRRLFDTADCTFRVGGKIPELWHPDTGVIETAPVWTVAEGRTTVPLNFEPAGSVFVLFRRAANNADHLVAMNSRATKSAARDARLTVKHAVYAASDGAPGSADVTKKLTDIVDDGQLQIAASNDLLDGDPSPNHVKELRVDYVFAGKSAHATVREGETLTFPGVASVGLPPPWEASLAADGSPLVQAWANGRVELRTAAGKELHAKVSRLPQPLPITGPWNLTFPPNWGAPPAVTLDNLISWTDHPDAGVRYFSGTATYDKTIEIHSDRLRAGRELWLDLGAVKNFAEVELNGQNLGILWKPPFRVNLTPVAKTGANHLVVKVTNFWPNRLIGDEQLPPDVEWDGKQLKEWPQWFLDGKPSPTGRLTFTTWHHWTKDSPLLQSGLLGPVTLRTAENVTVK